MKTYLVTGAAGFIGANYIKYILKMHDDVRVVVLDLLTYAGNLGTIAADIDGERCVFVRGDIGDRQLVDSLFATYAFDYVVNFAAESHVDRSIENPQLFLQTNILGTQNLLDAARRAWTRGTDAGGYPLWREGVRFHQVSTDEVYGSLGAEGYFREDTPLCPHSPYSASKASADLFVMAYHDTYHMPVSITRCSNNYGPYQFPEKLIPLFINNIRHRKPLPVYGKGENVRDWLYVEDHARAIDLVFHRGAAGDTYNIGGFNEWKNIDLIKVLIKTVDKALGNPEGHSLGLVAYVTDRKGHDLRYAIDSTKLQKELGWEPSLQFEEGIEKTVRWYLDNQEWLDNVTSGDYLRYYDEMYKAVCS